MLVLNNPIFKREFIASVRSIRTNFLLWGYLILLSLVLLLLWPGGGIHSVASTSGRSIFALFFGINLTLLILLVPAFSATSITFEKENRTFASLFTTLLSPSEILLGKLAASISILIAFVCFSLPISSICALTGGISFSFMFKVTSVIFATAFSYGFIGLACSSVCTKSSTAIILNYTLILLFAAVSWLPNILLSDLIGFQDILHIIRNCSPYDALFFLLYPDTYRITMGTPQTVTLFNPYIIFLFISLFMTSVAFIVFRKNILKRSSGKSKTVDMYTGSKKSIKRKLSWPFYLIDPLKRKKNIGRWSNPVFIAEMRSKLFANPKIIARIISIIFILSLGILFLVATQYAVNFSADMVNMVAIVFQIGVVAMLAPSVSSGLITDEITAGTLMPLRMTPITPVKMVAGKLKATFFYALIFIISSFFVIIAMAYLVNQNVFPEEGSIFSSGWWRALMVKTKEPGWAVKVWETYWRLVMWVVILLLSTVTFLTGGLFASSISRKTGVATAISYTITSIICLVSFAPVVLGSKLSHAFSMLVLSVNPIAAAMQIMSGTAFQEFPGLWKYNIFALLTLIVFFLSGAIVRSWYLFNKQN
jgi:ABC-type transport system involved in multi-copper enzyme maturation permease subunit